MNVLRPMLIALILISSSAPALQASDDPWREITPDVVYGHKYGMALTMDVVKPTKNANGAGVLFMVSGGWVSRWSPPERWVRESPRLKNVWEQIVEQGYTLFIVRHGSSPKFTVPDATEDVRKAVQYIRENADSLGIDPDRLGACGASAGGHLSLMLGTTDTKGRRNRRSTSARVAAVVAYYPPTDLRGLVGPSERFPALNFDADLAESVSPLLHVSSDDAPTLLVHGDQDRLVPLQHSQKIKKAMDEAKVPVELVVIKGAGHGFRGADRERSTRALIDWFNQHLVQQK